MAFIIKLLLFLHISAGFISLVLFWIPLISRKGGKNHRQTGKWYVFFMWIVVTTAAILSIKNIVYGNTIMAAFLGFISMITANPLWYGTAILKNKKNLSDRYKKIHLIFHSCIVLASLALIGYGILLGGKGFALLMFIFGGLGLSDVPTVIRAIRKSEPSTMWLKEHLIGMLSSGIAAYTAFLVFGANQFFDYVIPGYWAIVPWITPGVVGTFGIRYAVRKYTQ